MELEWNWISFLEMLSIEKTEPFIPELILPFDREHFPKVRRLARACLEFYMFPSISAPEGRADSPGLIEAWSHYREVEGVLSDKALHEFSKRYTDPINDVAQQSIYSDLQHWIGPDTADALKNWFTKNYRPCPDPVWRWPWALRLLFTELPEGVSPTTPAPITDDEQQYIKDFSIRYRNEQLALEIRFGNVIQAAKSEGPTLWEKVLQMFPADGIGNSYPWLGSVHQCLWFRLIRYEWSKLKTELGSGAMERLTKWARQEARGLPFNPTLSDEPEPL